MKKISLLAILALIPLWLSAQFSLRPQIGFNSTSINKSARSVDFYQQLGFQFGADMQLGGKVFLQPGIFWESSKNELQERIDGDRSEIHVNRIRIPVMLGYRVLSKRGGLVDLRLFTGPNAAFLVNKNVKGDPLIGRGELRNAVYGWNIGFGADLTFLFIDAGYMFGLNEIFEGVSSADRNNLFYANAGIRIGI